MPVENAIEVFNCSICSFCETSLDRLVKHIRQHIKPEPLTKNGVTAPIITNVRSEVVTQQSATPKTLNQRATNSQVSAGFYENHMRLMNEEKSKITEVGLNKSNLFDDLTKTEIEKEQTLHIDTSDISKAVVSPNMHSITLSPPPPLLHANVFVAEKRYLYNQPTVSFPSFNVVETLNAVNQPAALNFTYQRRQIYPENATNKPTHGYKREFVPIAPAVSIPHNLNEATNESRGTSSIDLFRRNLASTERTFKQNKQSCNGNQIGDRKIRKAVATTNNRHKQCSKKDKTAQVPNQTLQSKSDQQSNSPIYNLNPQLDKATRAALTSKIENNIGLPNQAGIIINPDQLLSVTGNPSLDNLAGVLVIPLKKTSEVGVQTEFGNANRCNENDKMSSHVQTELKMAQVLETVTNPSPLFNHIRSLDHLIECCSCGDEFQTEHHLKEHMKQHHTVVCRNCSFTSANLNEYNIHKEECDNDAEMLCMSCNNAFTSVRKLNVHRQNAHDVAMPFRCGICDAPFEQHEHVMKHILSHDYNATQFKCFYCIKLFESCDALNKHIAKHKTVDIMYECRFCHLTFSSDKLLKDHIGYVHVVANNVHSSHQLIREVSDQTPDDTGCNNLRKYFLCKHCDLAFKNRLLLKKHLEKCSRSLELLVTEFTCDVCKEFFQNEQFKKDHVKLDHKRSNGYRCPKCSKVYRTWSRLKFHTKQQHSKKHCSECLLVFTKEHILRKHQEEVHGKALTQPGERVYTCSLCNTMLFTLTDLMTHRKQLHPDVMQSKSNEKQSSGTSTKTYSKPTIDYNDTMSDVSLENEILLDDSNVSNDFKDDVVSDNEDTALSVEKCSQCNNIFTSKHDLHDHMVNKHNFEENNIDTDREDTESKVDTMEKYFCEICNAQFSEMKRLKNHLGLKHGKKPFNCDVCDKRFQYSSQVIWHMTHHRKDKQGVKLSTKSSKFNSMLKKVDFPVGSSSKKLYFTCQYCGLKFKQEKLLKNHKGTVHKIKLYSCEICNEKFGHSTELIWHARTCRAKYKRSHPEMEFTSAENEQKFDMGHDYKKEDATYPDYKCHICEATFRQLEEYQEHMSSHVGKEINGPTNFNNKLPSMVNINGSFDCNQNSAFFPSYDKASSVLENPQGNLILDKEPPLTNLSNITQLETYQGNALEILKEEPVYDVTIGEYRCPICHKTTKSITGMKTHYGRVHGVWSKETTHKNDSIEMKIWLCKYCDREFGQYRNLFDHTQSIHGVTITENEAESSVRYEVKKAGEERMYHYSCPHCLVTFDNSKAIRVHTFKKHGMLLNESDLLLWRSNIGESNDAPIEKSVEQVRYKCLHCTAKFHTVKAIRVHTFKRHNFILSKKEVLKCKSFLQKSYFSKTAMNRNRGKDLVDEPNPCDQCGRVFGNYRALFTHHRQAHREFNATKTPKKPSRTELSSSFSSPMPISPPLSSPSMTDRVSYSPPQRTLQSNIQISGENSSPINRLPSPLITELNENDIVVLPPTHADKKSNELSTETPPVPTIECPKCDRIFTQRKSLITHMFSAHRITKEKYHIYWPNGMPVLPRKSSTCPTCGKVCIDERAVRIHIFKAHGIKYQDMVNQGLNTKPAVEKKVAESDESELRYVESSNGPPVCFICSRLFKTKKALIMHEFKYHGIKWSGKKRIFPSKVRNVPKFGKKNTYNKKPKTAKVTTSVQPSVSTSVINANDGFTCPECNAFYANRRAITTHLCRIHRYSRDKLHAYFDGLNGFTNKIFDRSINDFVIFNKMDNKSNNNIVPIQSNNTIAKLPANTNGLFKTENSSFTNNLTATDNLLVTKNSSDVDNFSVFDNVPASDKLSVTNDYFNGSCNSLIGADDTHGYSNEKIEARIKSEISYTEPVASQEEEEVVTVLNNFHCYGNEEKLNCFSDGSDNDILVIDTSLEKSARI